MDYEPDDFAIDTLSTPLPDTVGEALHQNIRRRLRLFTGWAR